MKSVYERIRVILYMVSHARDDLNYIRGKRSRHRHVGSVDVNAIRARKARTFVKVTMW